MIFFPKFRIKEKWKVQTPNEKMLKMYIGSQLNVPYKYKSQSSQSYNAINQQTSELLKQYASGERDINLNEEDLIKDLIRAYHYSSNPKQRLEAEKLQYAINKKIAYSKEKIKRLQNIGSLNSILNNKKRNEKPDISRIYYCPKDLTKLIAPKPFTKKHGATPQKSCTIKI